MQWRQPSVRMLGCHGGRQAQRWVVQVFKAVAPKEMMPVEHLRSDKGETQVFEGQYVLWGGEHSLFTRKLQAMLNYLAVPYTFKLKSEASQAAVEARLGTHFIPGLETPEGWFLHDTTPIGLMLNHKYPDRPLLPKTQSKKLPHICSKIGPMSGLVAMRLTVDGVIPIMLRRSPRASMPTASVDFRPKD